MCIMAVDGESMRDPKPSAGCSGVCSDAHCSCSSSEGVLECRTVGPDLSSWDFQFQYKLD